jgi:hypothetical protein
MCACGIPLKMFRVLEKLSYQKKILYPQRDERNSRGTTLISQHPHLWPLSEKREESGSILAHLPYTNGQTGDNPVLVDVSLSGNGEVPAGSTAFSASGLGVIFRRRPASGFTSPGLSLPGDVDVLVPSLPAHFPI